MKIVGISGLECSVPFKKAHWPGLDEREYRISQGHDSAAALLVDGEIVAGAAEERFTRQKHTGAFPIHAVRYCLAEGRLALDQIDEIAHAFDYSPCAKVFSLDPLSAALYREVYSRDKLLSLVGRDLAGYPPERVHQVDHHRAHAASV